MSLLEDLKNRYVGYRNAVQSEACQKYIKLKPKLQKAVEKGQTQFIVNYHVWGNISEAVLKDLDLLF